MLMTRSGLNALTCSVIGRLGDQSDALELLLLDEIEKGLDAEGIDGVGAEGDVVMLCRDVGGRGLGRDRRDAQFLGHLVDGDGDRGMEEARDADDFLLGGEAAIAGDAGLGAALIVLHGEGDLLAAEHAAMAVDVFDGEVGAAPDELPGGRIAGRRERDLEPDHHLVRGTGAVAGDAAHDRRQRRGAHHQTYRSHYLLPPLNRLEDRPRQHRHVTERLGPSLDTIISSYRSASLNSRNGRR